MNSKSKTPKTSSEEPTTPDLRPNILLIMADEYRSPRYDRDHGMKEEIKNIVGFRNGETSNYEHFFPGFMRLRQNAVVLSNHTIASSACIPSRAAMFTGQYGTRTGVTQTDGVFKGAEDDRFIWLQPDGIPTMGDWMKEAGYETYYFGKCHFAHPEDHSLEEFGFDEWENSWPEPHGTLSNNLGFFRDYGFTDLVTTFLRGKGLALDYDREDALGEPYTRAPWFAVASFTNPHDITTWPVLAGKVDPFANLGEPLGVPPQGTKSNPPEKGTWKIPLNPDGFPQHNADLPPNFNEDLYNNNKPKCQYEYSIKLGIALASKTGNRDIALNAPAYTGIPFPLADDPEKWGRAYLQYYTYLHYIVDKHIDKVLQTLDETGLSDNTIVIFVPDHGEYGGAHGGMLQKWHTAYQETLHVPVVVCLPPTQKVLTSSEIRQVELLTSHIDLLPTLLGFAGVDEGRRQAIADALAAGGAHRVPDLVGADLSGVIEGNQETIQDLEGTERSGVLFATDDMITQYVLPPDHIPEGETPTEELDDYNLFVDMVNEYNTTYQDKLQPLNPGPIMQPCHVVCYREGNLKLVRYAPLSPVAQINVGDCEWEMYDLSCDPTEETNLVQMDKYPFESIAEGSLPGDWNALSVASEAERLYLAMQAEIADKLMPEESRGPSLP